MNEESSHDRFQFRVWNKVTNSYTRSFSFTGLVYNDGKFRLFGSTCENIIIEQCTGIKDINGEFIYEGDIINISEGGFNDNLAVHWSSMLCMFVLNAECPHGIHINMITAKTMKVVGNIHQNPQLLG